MENKAFQEMLKAAVARIQKKTPEDMAQKAGIIYHKAASKFELESLKQSVIVEYPSCRLSEKLEEWHTLILLHYLEMADGTPLSGQWTTFGSLKDGLVRGTKFDHTVEEELQKTFCGKSLEQIREVCEKAGGQFAEGRADLCVEFFLFPQYSVLLKIWLEDEEFPLTGKMFVDSTAEHYLTMEDSVTAGSVILEKLKRLNEQTKWCK